MFHVKLNSQLGARTMFQRTEKGVDELFQKKYQLTQSERLILTLIDGTTNHEGLRAKLKGLASTRIEKAIHSLVVQKLVIEMPASEFDAELPELDAHTIALSLCDETLDPIADIQKHNSGNKRTKNALQVIETPIKKRVTVDFYLPLQRRTDVVNTDNKVDPKQRLMPMTTTSLNRRQSDLQIEKSSIFFRNQFIVFCLIVIFFSAAIVALVLF